MTKTRAAVSLVLIVGVVAAAAAAASWWRSSQQLADETAADIEDELANLDPVTRAAVLTRLGEDAATQVH